MLLAYSTEGRVTAALRSPSHLTVLYDAECDLCLRCRFWLEHQPAYVSIDFLAAQSPLARERYRGLPWLGADLVVVSERGEAWIGPAAFLMCLWATRQWREWSYRLSGPALAPLAERFFEGISKHRGRIASMVAPRKCEAGRCRHREVP